MLFFLSKKRNKSNLTIKYEKHTQQHVTSKRPNIERPIIKPIFISSDSDFFSVVVIVVIEVTKFVTDTDAVGVVAVELIAFVIGVVKFIGHR